MPTATPAPEPDPIALSALQHWQYCPRQCGLIHLEQVFDDNLHTLRGQAVHAKADLPGVETAKGVRVERALPLWHDTLAVAVAKRSHLLAYREVPCQEVLKQPMICAQSTADDPWRTVLQQLFGGALQEHQQTVATFDVAMTLVSAGYGIALAPATRLAGYAQRGIAVRPLAGAPLVVMAYLLHRCAALTEPQARFVRRARSMS